MLQHIRLLNVRTKSLHYLSPHLDRGSSLCPRLGHTITSSWNTRFLWKPNSQLSLRESKCVQNENLCSLNAGISEKENLHIKSKSQVFLISQSSCERDQYPIESQQNNKAFYKHNNDCIYNTNEKRQHHEISRGITSISQTSWRFYHEAASKATCMPWRSYCTGSQYHTGLQYHKTGSEAVKWKQGTQPGL